MPKLDKKNKSLNNDAAPKPAAFPDETMEALMALGKVLQRIHNRLVSEGVKIEKDAQYAKRKRDK